MKKLGEAGTIADIPLSSTSRLYFVRMENDQPVDEGWVTVDEAKRMNSADRRMHGTSMNRYFQDAVSAKAFSQSAGTVAPAGAEAGMPPGDGFGMGAEEPGLEGGADLGLGGEEDMGLGGGAGELGAEGDADLDFDMEDLGGEEDDFGLGGDDLGFEGDDDLLGDLGDEDELGLDDELGLEDEETTLEIVVPRRIRLVPESMQETVPTFRGKPRVKDPIGAEPTSDADYDPFAGGVQDAGGVDIADPTGDPGIRQVFDMMQRETGMDQAAMRQAMGDSEYSYLVDQVMTNVGQGLHPQKVLSILHDIQGYKMLLQDDEPAGEEPWKEADPSTMNPAAYQMNVSQLLMQSPEGGDITQAMQSDPEFYEGMSQLMMDGITRGTAPEETAKRIIDLFQNRGQGGVSFESKKTTGAGIVEALLSGDCTTEEAIDEFFGQE